MDRLPNFLIIGGMKCATTSLHYYLNLHPEIALPKRKEMAFFQEERNWSRGVDWYCAQFDSRSPLRGEATPGYTMYPRFRGVPNRIKALIPDVKLIYIVRDPIERLVSEYMHRLAWGEFDYSLTEFLATTPGERALNTSRYFYQLEQYLAHFSADQFHILTTESLRNDRAATLAAVFRFLGADDRFVSRRFSRVKHRTTEKRRLNPTGRRLFQLSERHLNKRFPGVQRAVVNLALVPFSDPPPRRPSLDRAGRERLFAQLAPDVAQLRAFSNLSLAEWHI